MKRLDFLQSLGWTAIIGGSKMMKGLTTSPERELMNQPKIIRSDEGQRLNVIGDIQTIKLSGKDTGGQFTLIEEENIPGTMIPLHVHSKEDEVFKVLKGQMELTVGDETTILNAGDIGFGPRGVPHSWKIVGSEKAKVISLADLKKPRE